MALRVNLVDWPSPPSRQFYPLVAADLLRRSGTSKRAEGSRHDFVPMTVGLGQ
jgi:hypothetical protein